MKLRMLVLAAALWLFAGVDAQAQSTGALEMGLDGGVTLQIVDDSHRTLADVSFPIPALRVGYFLTDRVEMEPRVAYQRARIDNDAFDSGEAQTSQSGLAGLALAYHGGEPGHSRFFIAGGAIALFAGGTTAENHWGAEVGFGYKASLAPRWAARLELSVIRTFGNDAFPAAWMPSLTVGFSHLSH